MKWLFYPALCLWMGNWTWPFWLRLRCWRWLDGWGWKPFAGSLRSHVWSWRMSFGRDFAGAEDQNDISTWPFRVLSPGVLFWTSSQHGDWAPRTPEARRKCTMSWCFTAPPLPPDSTSQGTCKVPPAAFKRSTVRVCRLIGGCQGGHVAWERLLR